MMEGIPEARHIGLEHGQPTKGRVCGGRKLLVDGRTARLVYREIATERLSRLASFGSSVPNSQS